MPQVAHIVVLMMENHSFDNVFGVLGRGDGLTVDRNGHVANFNVGVDGRKVHAFEMPSTCQLSTQPASDWYAAHRSWNEGANDGFVTSPSGSVSMGYFTPTQLPFASALAETFSLCDRWFAPCLAGTFVNRRYLLAGTSLGAVRRHAGRDLPANGTILDALDRHGITWRSYYVDHPQLSVFPALLESKASKIDKVNAFFSAAAHGTLPAVSFIDPDFAHSSEENPQDVRDGDAFTASIVNAVLNGPGWRSTILIWCYDEGGGYYDHVPPPPAPEPDHIRPALARGDPAGRFDRYGFRVPAVIVSPWSRPGYVSHVVHDHTSILRLIEDKWNLPSLTARDAAAADLNDCLDFTTPSFATPPSLPSSPGVDGSRASCAPITPTDIPPPSAVTA